MVSCYFISSFLDSPWGCGPTWSPSPPRVPHTRHQTSPSLAHTVQTMKESVCKRTTTFENGFSAGMSLFLNEFLFGARIFKPFKEPRNRFPAWRNRFQGIDSKEPIPGLLKRLQIVKYGLCTKL
jgi:hypothetical protein